MRVDHWPMALSEVAAQAEARRAPFAYGTWDCCLWAAEAVQAITGVDYMAALRGYASKEEADALLSEHGGLESLVTEVLGAESQHISRAMRGDVVIGELQLVPGESGSVLGICHGHVCSIAVEGGLRYLPTAMFKNCWSVE